MFRFKFDMDSQKERYENIKFKITKRDFYQKLNFYVLPFMPEKFRGRVVYFPETFEPELIYKRQKNKIQKLENDFNKIKDEFGRKLKKYFPELENLEIVISPSLYGTVGSYKLNETNNRIVVFPRYDRKVISLQKLIITALVHYYKYEPIDILERDTNMWRRKQEEASEIEKK